MDFYKTIADFPDASFIMAVIFSIVSAVPPFFAVALFVIWMFGSASSYFAILRFTGRKRFFHVTTAFSFAVFILSILFSSLNTAEIQVMNGYWVIFYALMTGLSYLGLSFYK